MKYLMSSAYSEGSRNSNVVDNFVSNAEKNEKQASSTGMQPTDTNASKANIPPTTHKVRYQIHRILSDSFEIIGYENMAGKTVHVFLVANSKIYDPFEGVLGGNRTLAQVNDAINNNKQIKNGVVIDELHFTADKTVFTVKNLSPGRCYAITVDGIAYATSPITLAYSHSIIDTDYAVYRYSFQNPPIKSTKAYSNAIMYPVDGPYYHVIDSWVDTDGDMIDDGATYCVADNPPYAGTFTNRGDDPDDNYTNTYKYKMESYTFPKLGCISVYKCPFVQGFHTNIFKALIGERQRFKMMELNGKNINKTANTISELNTLAQTVKNAKTHAIIDLALCITSDTISLCTFGVGVKGVKAVKDVLLAAYKALKPGVDFPPIFTASYGNDVVYGSSVSLNPLVKLASLETVIGFVPILNSGRAVYRLCQINDKVIGSFVDYP